MRPDRPHPGLVGAFLQRRRTGDSVTAQDVAGVLVAIRQLSTVDRHFLSQRFGLDLTANDPRSLVDLGRQYDVSPHEIRAREIRLLGRLARWVNEKR